MLSIPLWLCCSFDNLHLAQAKMAYAKSTLTVQQIAEQVRSSVLGYKDSAKEAAEKVRLMRAWIIRRADAQRLHATDRACVPQLLCQVRGNKGMTCVCYRSLAPSRHLRTHVALVVCFPNADEYHLGSRPLCCNLLAMMASNRRHVSLIYMCPAMWPKA